jgi:hypothetical protein
MAMYCPQCSSSFEQRLQCPTCGVRLLVPETRRGGFGLMSRGWQHTSVGRIFIGLLLAQGLFYGLRHLLTGVLLLVQGQNNIQEALTTLPGLIGVQALQIVALVLAGLVAAAGQRSGLLLGLFLGMLNGIIAVIAQQWPATATHSLLPPYGQPLIQGFVGAVSGVIGGTIWKPLAVVLSADSAQLKRKKLTQPRMPIFAGRIHWLRIFFGSAFAVVGFLSAHYLLERALKASSDALIAETYWQERVVTWEIKALAMVLGGILAGIGTTNGFKQGVFVGILGGAILNVALALRGVEYQVVVLTMVSSLCLSLSGGWFGGQLFPPLTQFQRARGGMGPASV